MRQYIIFGIFVYIYKKRKTTAREIAEKFEVSPRSVYRYIDILCYGEIPIETRKGRGGGIFLDQNYDIDKLRQIV